MIDNFVTLYIRRHLLLYRRLLQPTPLYSVFILTFLSIIMLLLRRPPLLPLPITPLLIDSYISRYCRFTIDLILAASQYHLIRSST